MCEFTLAYTLIYAVYRISLHGCFNSHMLSLEFTCLPDDYPVPQPAPSTWHVLVVQCDRCQPKPAGRTTSLSQHSLVMALWEWKHLSGGSVNGALERLGRLSTLLHCNILSGHHALCFLKGHQLWFWLTYCPRPDQTWPKKQLTCSSWFKKETVETVYNLK